MEGRYREIMTHYAEVPGEPNAYWLDRRDELNDLMMALLRQRTCFGKR